MQQIYRTPMQKCNLLNLHFDMGAPVNLLHNFRTPFPRNTSRQLLWNQSFILCKSKLNLIHNRWLFAKYANLLFIFCLVHFKPFLHYFHWYAIFSYWKYLTKFSGFLWDMCKYIIDFVNAMSTHIFLSDNYMFQL